MTLENVPVKVNALEPPLPFVVVNLHLIANDCVACAYVTHPLTTWTSKLKTKKPTATVWQTASIPTSNEALVPATELTDLSVTLQLKGFNENSPLPPLLAVHVVLTGDVLPEKVMVAEMDLPSGVVLPVSSAVAHLNPMVAPSSPTNPLLAVAEMLVARGVRVASAAGAANASRAMPAKTANRPWMDRFMGIDLGERVSKYLVYIERSNFSAGSGEHAVLAPLHRRRYTP